MLKEEPASVHYHKDEQGLLVKCYHHGMRNATLIFWWVVSTVVAFPLEHALYTHVWPFNVLSKWLGL